MQASDYDLKSDGVMGSDGYAYKLKTRARIGDFSTKASLPVRPSLLLKVKGVSQSLPVTSSDDYRHFFCCDFPTKLSLPVTANFHPSPSIHPVTRVVTSVKP